MRQATYPSREELEGIVHDAVEDWHLWRFRAVIATLAFVGSCACSAPFAHGMPLHGYWESIGKPFLILCMILWAPFVICVGAAVYGWTQMLAGRKCLRLGANYEKRRRNRTATAAHPSR